MRTRQRLVVKNKPTPLYYKTIEWQNLYRKLNKKSKGVNCKFAVRNK